MILKYRVKPNYTYYYIEIYGTTPVTPHYTYYTYFSIVEQALVFFLDSVVPFLILMTVIMKLSP